MRAAEIGVEALPQDPAVAHDHRADQRIRARPPAATLGKLDRALEVLVVGGLKGAHVRSDDIGPHELRPSPVIGIFSPRKCGSAPVIVSPSAFTRAAASRTRNRGITRP